MVWKKIVRRASSILSGDGPLEERRKPLRVPCQIPVELEHPDEGLQKGTVTDISIRGLRMRCPVALAKGQSVALRAVGAKEGPALCKVLWCKIEALDYMIGLHHQQKADAFVDSWLDATRLGFGQQIGDLREKRTFIRFPAPGLVVSLVGESGTVAQGVLLNLGAGGALVECPQRLNVGSTVRLCLTAQGEAPLDERAVVRSCFAEAGPKEAFAVGLEFAEASPAGVRRWIRVLRK